MKDKLWFSFYEADKAEREILFAAGVDRNQVRLFWYDKKGNILTIHWDDNSLSSYEGKQAHTIFETLTE